MSDHNDDDNFQEDRKLSGNGSFIRKSTESAGDKYRQDRNDHAGHDL